MTVFATAGSKFYIGAAIDTKNADFAAADFTSQEWVEVKPLESIGSLGDSANSVTMDAIGQSRTIKLKGSRNAGDMQIVAGIDYADPGQIALIAAEKTNNNYAFKVVFNDKPAGQNATPSSRLFVGMVMSAAEALEGANNVMKLNATVAVNSNIVRVDAAAGA